jgi:hypothetical protein
MEIITIAITETLIPLITNVFVIMTRNALLTFFIAVSVLLTGVRVFRRMRRAAG